MPTSKIYIPDTNPWYWEMVLSMTKDNQGELVYFLTSQNNYLSNKS